MVPGRGVSAVVDGAAVLAGNAEFLAENGIALSPSSQAQEFLGSGCTVIYIASGGEYAGFIALSDTLRAGSGAMTARLRRLGVVPVLLTGDHASAAGSIAEKAGISEIHAECLPEDKLRHIDGYQRSGRGVCMIGDGINDAPALKKALVGIAMGGAGSDIAVDAADIALVNDDVGELPHLVVLSKRMMTTIKLGLTFSMALNFTAIALAMTGLLGPVIGALVHNAGSVIVIINSALLLRWKEKE